MRRKWIKNGTRDALTTFVNLAGHFSSKIDLIMCEDEASQLSLRNTPLPSWMTVQVLETVPDQYIDLVKRVCIIFVTAAYLTRLDEYVSSKKENGCSKELCDIAELVGNKTRDVFLVKGPNVDRREASEKMRHCVNARNPGKDTTVDFTELVWYKYDNANDVRLIWESIKYRN